MSATAHDLIKVAKSQVGVHESRSGGHWTNGQRYSKELPGFDWSDGQPWCDTFASWCAWKAGLTETEFPRSASCDASGADWKHMGRWSEYPAVGAQVLFGTSSDLSHTGIVAAFDDTFIHTIEGNTNSTGSREGDGVYAKIHERRDARVIGYGYPRFSHPIVSADPKWSGTPAPAPQPNGAKIRGTDWSHHNDLTARWQLMRNAGVRFAMHKVTQGTTFVDPNYRKRRAELDAFNKSVGAVARLFGKGVKPGGYHFRGDGTPGAEAAFFLKHLVLAGTDVAPWLDLEILRKGETLAEADRWAVAWLKAVKAVTGRAGLYSNFDLPLAAQEADFVVRARYNSTDTPPALPYDIWQFSDGTNGVPNRVAGYGGPLDLSTFRKGFRLRKMRVRLAGSGSTDGGDPSPTPTPEPAPEPQPQPQPKAQRVVVAAHNGQFGHKVAEKRIDIAELETASYTRAGKTKPGVDADVVFLCEWGTYGKVLPGSSHVRYKGEGKPGQPSTPCDYRPTIFRRSTIHTASRLLSGPAQVPASIPGPADTKPKYAHQVLGMLRDAQVPVRFIPYHGNVRPNASKATKELRKEQVDALVKLIGECHQRGEAVVLGGDFNCAAKDPATGGRLKAAGMTLVAVADLMQIWVTASPPSGSIGVVSKRTVKDTDSDHDVPVVELEFAPNVMAA